MTARRCGAILLLLLGTSVAHAEESGTPDPAPSASAADSTQRAVLGRFVTTYVHDEAHKGRAFNVELAAQAFDGKVLAPGALLSFNEAVGERTAAFGYEKATVIRDGMLAEGTGGGACQVASTLHTAALLSGLEIVARTPHSRASAYIRMGFDATVAASAGPGAPAIDLKVRNVLPAAITVRSKASKGNLEIWFEGPGSVRRKVTLKSQLEGRVRHARVARVDKSVPDDTVRIIAYGAPGFRVRRTREIEDVDGVIRRDVRIDHYASTDEVGLVSAKFNQASWTGAPKAEEGDDGLATPSQIKVVIAPSAVPPALVQVRPSDLVTLDNTGR
jgi:vancomycin resistance protein YoaR